MKDSNIENTVPSNLEEETTTEVADIASDSEAND